MLKNGADNPRPHVEQIGFVSKPQAPTDIAGETGLFVIGGFCIGDT